VSLRLPTTFQPPGDRAIFVLSAAGYSALAIALTYPLVRHLSTTLPHDLGDPLLSTTLVWWNAHTTPLTDRWWDAFFFWPAPGAMAMSDHRLGESLLATPLQWMGATAITATNVVLLVTFPLSALAAHFLVFTIGRRHDAALLAGLAYGFCPYRIAHLQHIELLAGFGMPIALAALHRTLQTTSLWWLTVFAAALVVQALSSSYYALFSLVLLVLWVFWFVGWRDRGMIVRIGAAGGAAAVVLAPIAIGYERIHSWYGFERKFDEIVRLSADLTALGVATPLSVLWGWTSSWARAEGELFPGLTITVLAIVGVGLAWQRAPRISNQIDRWRAYAATAAFLFAAIALCGWMLGPWRIDARVLTISSAAPFKPFSLAVLAGAAWIAASPRMRLSYAEGSALVFYAIATMVLLLCAMGPKPTALGHQFLYEPIYAWLIELPVFDSVRVPARFAMPAMIALSVTGALAFNSLFARTSKRRALALVFALGIVADGWIARLPLQPLPTVWPAARAAGFAAVLELPLGDTFDDIAAMHRATMHGRPVVNGNSGFEPTHYFTLRTALEEHDSAVFDGFPAGAPILIVADKTKASDPASFDWLGTVRDVRALEGDDRWAFFAAHPSRQTPSTCAGAPARIASVASTGSPVALSTLTDANPQTWWDSSHAQRVGDALTFDLGTDTQPCAVVVSVGEFRASYARKLVVETSVGGDEWRAVAVERGAGLTMRGALANPRSVSFTIPLSRSVGRFVRLRLDESHPSITWIVTDVAIIVASEAE